MIRLVTLGLIAGGEVEINPDQVAAVVRDATRQVLTREGSRPVKVLLTNGVSYEVWEDTGRSVTSLLKGDAA